MKTQTELEKTDPSLKYTAADAPKPPRRFRFDREWGCFHWLLTVLIFLIIAYKWIVQ